MDMTGEYVIPAPRQKVWEALNDTEVLKQCIPGCETITRHSETEMSATVKAKVGPVSARFGGKVTISDIDPPNGYRISGEGQGGVAGFAKGGANVSLTDDGADTLLSYTVNAQVGGKLAQLGGRLIDATAKQMADAFFDRFSAQVQAMSPAAVEAAAGESMAEPIAVALASLPAASSVSVWALVPSEPFGLPIAAWVGGGVFVVMMLLMLGSML